MSFQKQSPKIELVSLGMNGTQKEGIFPKKCKECVHDPVVSGYVRSRTSTPPRPRTVALDMPYNIMRKTSIL